MVQLDYWIVNFSGDRIKTTAGDSLSRPNTVCGLQPFLPQTATSNSLALMEVIEIDIPELWYQPKLN